MSEVEIVPVTGKRAVSASLAIEGTGAFFLGRKVLKTGRLGSWSPGSPSARDTGHPPVFQEWEIVGAGHPPRY
jgi:hypothetical protein